MDFAPYVKVLSFSHADMTFATGGSVRMPIEKGTFVYGVAMVITEGFTGSGLFQVGIEDDLDAFVTPAYAMSGSEIRAYSSMGLTTGSMPYQIADIHQAFTALAHGKYFTTASSIVVSMTIGSALYNPTTGHAKLYALCVGTDSNWRRTASGY